MKDVDLTRKAAMTLGIYEERPNNKKDEVIFEDEGEFDALTDFILNEPWLDGDMPIERYRREYDETLSQPERHYIDSLAAASTSLYKITDVYPEEDTMKLQNLLSNERADSILTDIHLSKTARQGMLMFTRLLNCEGFCMTSGVSFLFRSGLEKYLIRRYKKLQKKVDSDIASICRFVAFFHLNRTDGQPAVYEEV
jgi:hypothetical protein